MRKKISIWAIILLLLFLSACGSTASTSTGDEQAATGASGNVARGEEIVKGRGCLACHSIDGSKLAGPTFKGLFNAEVALDDGSSIEADAAYLRESILQPSARTVQGYPAGTMPAFNLDDAQIEDVVAYLISLK